LEVTKPENILFNNYKYAELIGKQYLILDYIDRTKNLSPELTQKVDDIWKRMPVIGSAAEKSRAYINSCYFYCERLLGQYKRADMSKTYLYNSGLGSFRIIDSVFKKNSRLFTVLIFARLKSMIFLAQDSIQLAGAINKINEYKDYAIDRFTKSAIEGEISRKKAQLQILFAKNFTLVNAKGDSIELSHLKNEFILLDFWATWCVPCIKDILKFRDSSINFRKDVKIVFINIDDTYPKWMNFLKKNSLVVDNFLFATKEQSFNLKESYGFYMIPHKILLDSNRKIISSGSENAMDFLNNRPLK
jgi:thiol-disulfide isomerase/thioredoxin